MTNTFQYLDLLYAGYYTAMDVREKEKRLLVKQQCLEYTEVLLWLKFFSTGRICSCLSMKLTLIGVIKLENLDIPSTEKHLYISGGRSEVGEHLL